MTEEDDVDGLAAEYVLGSLSPSERKVVGDRRRTDVALDDAVKAWERRFQTLGDRLPGIEPPAHLLESILARISGQGVKPAQSAEIISLHRRSRRWRALAITTSALAACLALVVGWIAQTLPGTPTSYVAVLQRSAGATADQPSNSRPPAFVVTIDLKSRAFTVTPVAARPVARRSYALWLMQEGRAMPRSLGVVSQSGPTTVPWLDSFASGDLVNATLAVSLEPEGASPPDTPTGPVVFVGRLVQAAD